MPRSKLTRLIPPALCHRWLMGAARLFVVGLLLGWVYGWAETRLYPRETRCGFFRGMTHGACMPMALPALVLGKDVPIYSEHNSGRGYKLGYIVGINLCGLVFFGGAFWKPRRAMATDLTTTRTDDSEGRPNADGAPIGPRQPNDLPLPSDGRGPG